MEPQDNTKLAITKAINAHEEAKASLHDLLHSGDGTAFTAMMERIEQNLAALRLADAGTSAADGQA